MLVAKRQFPTRCHWSTGYARWTRWARSTRNLRWHSTLGCTRIARWRRTWLTTCATTRLWLWSRKGTAGTRVRTLDSRFWESPFAGRTRAFRTGWTFAGTVAPGPSVHVDRRRAVAATWRRLTQATRGGGSVAAALLQYGFQRHGRARLAIGLRVSATRGTTGRATRIEGIAPGR